MASIILKWVRRCLFICVCAVFLMSHNASAVNYGSSAMYPIDAAVMAWGGGAGYITGQRYNNGYNLDGSVATAYTADITSASILTQTAIPANSLISFDLKMCSTVVSYTGLIPQSINVYKVSEQSQVYNGCATSHIVLYTYVATNDFSFANNIASVANGDISVRISGFSVTVLSGQIDNTQQINNIANNLGLVNSNLNDISNKLDNVSNSVDNIKDDVKQDTQDAADAAADSGDLSAADAENATAGLISVIGGFVNAITSATPTNCKINGKINNSFNMGELDLCSMPVPPFVQIISSLILIAICIPFAIVMFNRFIGLFRSFQG